MASVNDPTKNERREIQEQLIQKVGANEVRKVKARREKKYSIWFGLGMIGVIGWTVVIPTLIGVALGIWLDAAWPGPLSWTLTLLLTGLGLGCLNAWRWVAQEQKEIGHRGDRDDNRD
ncbi:MAG: AtpZ/AtpI family protein [Anaerolineaceae bacterium]|nr:AtpZ/AtpI family protein [Anaerolineaceae bacterium]MCB9106139.1 AtpZ/AtpI family protein [Anaerolineales bacterium]